VFGPVDAVYADSAPSWWRSSGLHNTRPTILKDGLILTGYTCNVLLRTESLDGLRFRLNFGKSGGEDTLFFHDLYCMGARFAYAPRAEVKEPVAATRMRLKWLLARSFLGGQLHMSMSIIDKRALTPIVATSILKLMFSLANAGLNVLKPAEWRRNLMRASLHVGVMARGLGYREIPRKNH
jgi:succinoglycan biosynthesis protein ExoM